MYHLLWERLSWPEVQMLSLPLSLLSSLHISSVIPPSASGLWQLVHQQLRCTFLLAKKKFPLFQGWGAGLFCSAGESCLNGEQEHNTTSRNYSVADDRRNHSAGTNRTPPWQKSVFKSVGISLSFADISSSVDWQTGNWQLSPLASTPLRF